MYAIATNQGNHKTHRTIEDWAKSIDKEIKRLCESQEKAYTTLRFSTQRHNAALLGGVMAQYYTEELDAVLNRVSAYYCHLIADLQQRKQLAFEQHENRKGSQDTHNLYAELIAEFKAFKKFMGGRLDDFIISIVPDGVNRYDMRVTEEKLQQHVRHIEKRGIGMTVVRQSGRMYIYRHI